MTQLHKIIRYFFHLLDHSIIQSFLTQIIIFDSNGQFWPKLLFLTQMVIFDPNCHFWSKWSFLIRAFWNEIKGRFRQRIRSFWPHLMERSFLTTMFFVIYELFIRQVYHRLVFCKSYKFRISEFYAKCSKYIPVPSGLFWFWFRIFPFFRSERIKGTRIQFLNRKKFRFILILWVIIWPRLERIDQNYRIFGWALCSDQLNLVSLFWEDDTLIIEFNSFKLDYVNPNLGILKWQSNNTLISPRK